MLVLSRRLAALFGVAAAVAAVPAAATPSALPAFPGAVGFGASATGGRGGAVYHVTNLDDSGRGSLRDAVSKGKRTVVFDVGGAIELRSPLPVASDLTLAGQTAPGEGIVVKNYEVSLTGSHNVIVRYLRFRQGPTPSQRKKYTLSLNETKTVIFDHCSIEWGSWDNVGMSKSDGVTMQFCIIGESIDLQRFGCLCQSDNVTFAYNLWTNNQSRNPKGKGKIQYINNVVYNWGVCGYAGGHSGADHWADLINNYFIKGPSSNDRFTGEYTATDHIYQAGNRADMNRDGLLNGRPLAEADFADSKGKPVLENHPFFAETGFTPDSAEEAYQKVIAGAGASHPYDAIDSRLISEVTSLGKRGQITHAPKTLPPVPPLRGGGPPPDTDGDGIPDAWEQAHGLNPADASDGAGLAKSGFGYTNVEVYLNSLCPPPH